MPQILALEWNDDEARLVAASLRGADVVIEQAFAVDLRDTQPDGSGEPVDVGTRLAAAVAARGLGRCELLVAVGRSDIELRQLSLPPVPDDELPEIVRFQALREFNELTEAWSLDFVPLDTAESGPRSVLAAAIDPKTVAQIRRTCEAAELKPQRLILRPCAAASLLSRSGRADPERLTLLVDLLHDEADLTVIDRRQVVFLRTVRLAGDPLEKPAYSGPLVAEIRRTMAAAQNQLGGRQVESIVLCGTDEPQAVLAKAISDSLSTQTELFDPFAGLRIGRELRDALPEQPGRFAPLLGMTLDELTRSGHAIDFLHPRQPPEPTSPRRKWIALAATVGVLVFGFLGFRAWQRSQLVGEINTMNARLPVLDKQVKAAAVAVNSAGEIEKWTATDVDWLDEFSELSQEFLPAKQAMLTQLTFARGVRGGKITLEGLAASASSISELEKRLLDERHRVKGEGSSEEGSRKYYSRSYSSVLYVDPEKK